MSDLDDQKQICTKWEPSDFSNVNEKHRRNPGWLKAYQRWIETGDDSEIPTAPSSSQLPALPVDPKSLAFGLAMRQELFIVDPACAFLNHGSYGGSFKQCIEYREKLIRYMEHEPVAFMEDCVLPSLVKSVRAISSFINCAPRDVVLVPNATSGINAVIKSWIPRLQKGDKIACMGGAYGGCYNALAYVAKVTGADLVTVDLPYPYTKEGILSSLRAVLETGNVKIIMLDHIMSFPCVVLPLQAMITLCKEYKTLVCVDGAHAVGNVDTVDMKALDVDFYTSNCHKWLCTPKAVAFLYVKPQHQATMVNTTISHGHQLSGFATEFAWQATFDYTPYFTVAPAIDLFHQIGFDKIREYNHDLVDRAADYLHELWGQNEVFPVLERCTMRMIYLPNGRYDDGYTIHRLLRQVHNVEAPVGSFQGKLILRISAQMYNSFDEYERLGKAVLALQNGDDNISDTTPQ